LLYNPKLGRIIENKLVVVDVLFVLVETKSVTIFFVFQRITNEKAKD